MTPIYYLKFREDPAMKYTLSISAALFLAMSQRNRRSKGQAAFLYVLGVLPR